MVDLLQPLKKKGQWVVWCAKPRNGGGVGKIPIDPKTLKRAKTNQPRTWASFETATQAVGLLTQKGECVEGVGVVIAAGLVGVDFDKCTEPGGALVPPVREFLQTSKTYGEFSPSGRGVHALFELMEPVDFSTQGKGDGFAFEIYAYKNGGRYFTVTEKVIKPEGANVPQKISRAEFFNLVKLLKEKTPPTVYAARAEPRGARPGAKVSELSAADRVVLRRAGNSRNGEKFRNLYQGDTSAHSGDHSRADAALVALLMFWTHGDERQTDRLFRSSGLYRKKWDSVHFATGETYGERLIKCAKSWTSQTNVGKMCGDTNI